MSIDGMEWDVPDTPANAAAFGFPGTGKDGAPGPFPKARVVTVAECASHALVLAAIGPAGAGKGTGEQSLAAQLYPRLEPDWLLIADRHFYITGVLRNGEQIPLFRLRYGGSAHCFGVAIYSAARARYDAVLLTGSPVGTPRGSGKVVHAV